jgi:uncharacterized protein YozE (UPF0346 family)
LRLIASVGEPSRRIFWSHGRQCSPYGLDQHLAHPDALLAHEVLDLAEGLWIDTYGCRCKKPKGYAQKAANLMPLMPPYENGMDNVMEQIEQAQQTSEEERFLQACCKRDPAAWVRPAKLYSASWCEGQEIRPLSITQVAPVWKRLGLRRSVVHGYPRYWGVKLLMKGEEKLSFNRWLVRQRRRIDLVGALAYNAYGDVRWPKGRPGLDAYVNYLEDFGASSEALNALRQAWEEWLEYGSGGDDRK